MRSHMAVSKLCFLSVHALRAILVMPWSTAAHRVPWRRGGMRYTRYLKEDAIGRAGACTMGMVTIILPSCPARLHNVLNRFLYLSTAYICYGRWLWACCIHPASCLPPSVHPQGVCLSYSEPVVVMCPRVHARRTLARTVNGPV